MSLNFANWETRTLDLAIERFTVGLEEREETSLQRATNADDLLDFEAAVSAVQLSALGELEAPPADFLARLESSGRAIVEERTSRESVEVRAIRKPQLRLLPFAGWLVAAALLLLFNLPTETRGLDVLRANLIADASDVQSLEWSSTGDPAGASASGDVVWSSQRQEGYMRFSNLEPNNPSVAQYQLWIFDPTRADWEAKPVDGGVFDVTADGQVIVPIDPKLEVRESVLYAVTLEVPGGVVVSERERLVLTASL